MSALQPLQKRATVTDGSYLHDLFVDSGAPGRMTKERDAVYMAFRAEIAARLKLARTRKGLSQGGLADLVQVRDGSIAKWEAGEVPWERISQLGEALEVDPWWLLKGDSALEQLREVREQADQLAGTVTELSALLSHLVPHEAEQA